MNKEIILARIKACHLPKIPCPEIPESFLQSKTSISEFIEAAKKSGSEVREIIDMSELQIWIKEYRANGSKVVDLVFDTKSLEKVDTSQRKDLTDIDIVILQAQWGVSENGAVWVDENSMIHRALPFIPNQLCILISKDNIVSNMHQAYERIQLEASGFGVFIAGPSKTADIEQALVIGAQGPLKSSIWLI